MKKLFLFFLFPLCTWAQGIDFTHLKLEVDFLPEEGRVNGRVHLGFTAQPGTDSIYLNGINMQYRKVLLNGKEVAYKHDHKGIWLLPEAGALSLLDSIEIGYTCRPRRGIFFVGWNDPSGRARKQIWTQGQGVDHRHWIPHKDDQTDKLRVALKVRFDSTYQVVANGVLKAKSAEQAGMYTWEYSMQMPMSSYLIALAIGKYAVQQTHSKAGLPLYQYFYQDRAGDYPLYYWRNEEIFDTLQDWIKVPFPWQNYKQVPVVNFQHGAMENTTATIFGDFFMADSLSLPDRNYPYVNAHELAHQWFGNLVTAKNSDHHWLHEGFATYYQWLIERALYGQAHFDWQRKLGADQVFAAAAQDSFPLMSGKAGSARFYQKGAWVLYMMQNACPAFEEGIGSFLHQYAFGVVETDDLLRVLQEKQCFLEDFFNYWVKSPEESRYEVRQIMLHKKELMLEINPLHTASPGNEPGLELVYKSGLRETVYPGTGKATIPLKGKLAYWNFNPGMDVLATVEEEKPDEMWFAQCFGELGDKATYESRDLSTGTLDRYEAVTEMDVKKSGKSLLRVLDNAHEFFAVRARALEKLLAFDYDTYLPALHAALTDKDVQLQKEAVKMVADQSPLTLVALEKIRFGKSYALRENVLYKSVLPDQPETNRWLWDKRYAEEPGIQGQNVYIASLAYRAGLYGDVAALDALKDRTTQAFDFLTRMNAMGALLGLDYFEKDMLPAYFEGLFNTNRKLLRTARHALQTYYWKEEAKKAIDEYIESRQEEWSDFQKRMAARTFTS